MAFSLLLQHAMEIPAQRPWEVSRLTTIAFSPQGDRAVAATLGPPALLDFRSGSSRDLVLPRMARG